MELLKPLLKSFTLFMELLNNRQALLGMTQVLMIKMKHIVHIYSVRQIVITEGESVFPLRENYFI